MFIASILHDSLVNGEGLRTVVFAQGCSKHCKNCHNKHTWSKGKGTEITVKEVVDIIEKNSITKKVTFSGGDPLEQLEEFTKLAKELKAKGYNIWCYTGYTKEEIGNKDILKYIDVLVDGRYVEGLKTTEKYIGSSNQIIWRLGK